MENRDVRGYVQPCWFKKFGAMEFEIVFDFIESHEYGHVCRTYFKGGGGIRKQRRTHISAPLQ